MWIDKRLPSLRRHPVYGILVTCGLIATTVLLKLAFPGLPPFLPLYPVVVLSALVGGRMGGIIAWIACSLLGAHYFSQSDGSAGPWSSLTIVGFCAVSALIVFVVDLLDSAVQRLHLERNRLELALRAGNLATWELHPDGRLRWDDSFYEMLGLNSRKEPPSTERFLAMIHPDDRARMQEARMRMERGELPAQRDEYRLTRPDGRMIWLENHRAGVKGDSQHFIGITQDISARKRYERRINALMRELAHRVKNQYAVILAMVRETNKQARSPQEFETLLQARIAALSRSHDLLVEGEWESADLKDLLIAHVEAFAAADRLDARGPPIALSAMAAQYFGMAFHELCTNAIKHGALSVPEGRVVVDWDIRPEDEAYDFALTWQEMDGPQTRQADSIGFGSKVLNHLMPAAISGQSETEMAPGGLIWRLKGRLNAISSTDAQSSHVERTLPAPL